MPGRLWARRNLKRKLEALSTWGFVVLYLSTWAFVNLKLKSQVDNVHGDYQKYKSAAQCM